MSNITAETSSNVPIKIRCEAPAHMKKVSMEGLQERFLQTGYCMTGSLEDVKMFVRKRYPALTDDEVMDTIERRVVFIQL